MKEEKEEKEKEEKRKKMKKHACKYAIVRRHCMTTHCG